jgi:hypothetical protein
MNNIKALIGFLLEGLFQLTLVFFLKLSTKILPYIFPQNMKVVNTPLVVLLVVNFF